MKRSIRLPLLILGLFALCALPSCGGGGGGGNAAPGGGAGASDWDQLVWDQSDWA